MGAHRRAPGSGTLSCVRRRMGVGRPGAGLKRWTGGRLPAWGRVFVRVRPVRPRRCASSTGSSGGRGTPATPASCWPGSWPSTAWPGRSPPAVPSPAPRRWRCCWAPAAARGWRACPRAGLPVPAVPELVAVALRPGRSRSRWGPGTPPGEWRTTWTDAEHADAVRVVQEAIARGETYQANVVGHRSAPHTGDPVALAAAVAGLPGAVYGGVLAGDGWAVGCASPEQLVRTAGGRGSPPCRSRAPRRWRPAATSGCWRASRTGPST